MNLFCVLTLLITSVHATAIQPIHDDAVQIRELLQVLHNSIETSETLLEFISSRATEIETSLEGTVDCHDEPLEAEEEEGDEDLPTVEIETEGSIHDRFNVDMFGSEATMSPARENIPTEQQDVSTGQLGPALTEPTSPGELATQLCFIKEKNGVRDTLDLYNHAM